MLEPEIGLYVRSLADYNRGSLNGRWFDLTQYGSYEELENAITDWLRDIDSIRNDSINRQEWAFHDYSGISSVDYSEYMGASTLEPYFEEVLPAAGEFGIEAVRVYLDHIGGAEYFTKRGFAFAFYGEFRSRAEFARHYAEGTCLFGGTCSQTIINHFDFDSYGRELIMGDFFEVDGYYFRRL